MFSRFLPINFKLSALLVAIQFLSRNFSLELLSAKSVCMVRVELWGCGRGSKNFLKSF